MGLQVCRRYDTVVYRLHQGTSTLELECPGGVVVGDVLGPLAFVLYMDDFLRDLQTRRSLKRGAKQILAQETTWMTRLRQTAGGQELVHSMDTTRIELSDVIYADDHDVIQPVEGWKDIKDNINMILDTQRGG